MLKELEKFGIVPEWFVVNDFCACLIKKGGDPSNVDDRVAFIEKSPRVLIEGEWIYGPKGSGGCIETEGETIYGFYQPSRDWCEKELLDFLSKKDAVFLVSNLYL